MTASGGAGEGGEHCRVFPKTTTYITTTYCTSEFAQTSLVPTCVSLGSCLSMLSAVRNMEVLNRDGSG